MQHSRRVPPAAGSRTDRTYVRRPAHTAGALSWRSQPELRRTPRPAFQLGLAPAGTNELQVYAESVADMFRRSLMQAQHQLQQQQEEQELHAGDVEHQVSPMRLSAGTC